jgi:hypothetical protein
MLLVPCSVAMRAAILAGHVIICAPHWHCNLMHEAVLPVFSAPLCPRYTKWSYRVLLEVTDIARMALPTAEPFEYINSTSLGAAFRFSETTLPTRRSPELHTLPTPASLLLAYLFFQTVRCASRESFS